MTLNETSLEKRFNLVSTSQASIQSLSFFCLHYKEQHRKIAHIWLRCLQKAKVSHRLTLIYLANDIIQNARRKNILSFRDDFKLILKDTIPYLRDEKIKKSVERVFSIWQDRNIYDSKFTNELKNALNGSGRILKSESVKPETVQQGVKHSTNDLLASIDALSNIEKSIEKFKSVGEDFIERWSQGQSDISDEDSKTLNDLKEYVTHLKSEIDERNKLAKLLEDTMNKQRRLLKESEEQLNLYKSQLEYITKVRDSIL